MLADAIVAFVVAVLAGLVILAIEPWFYRQTKAGSKSSERARATTQRRGAVTNSQRRRRAENGEPAAVPATPLSTTPLERQYATAKGLPLSYDRDAGLVRAVAAALAKGEFDFVTKAATDINMAWDRDQACTTIVKAALAVAQPTEAMQAAHNIGNSSLRAEYLARIG